MSESFDVEDDLLTDDEELVDDEADYSDEPERRFANVGEWVEGWFQYVVAGPYSSKEVAGSRTWCPMWWDHKAVAAPLAALHEAWEAARVSEDPAAMSTWWVHHAHPHIRWLCDASSGPMYRCARNGEHEASHTADDRLATIAVPAGWFDPDAAS